MIDLGLKGHFDNVRHDLLLELPQDPLPLLDVGGDALWQLRRLHHSLLPLEVVGCELVQHGVVVKVTPLQQDVERHEVRLEESTPEHAQHVCPAGLAQRHHPLKERPAPPQPGRRHLPSQAHAPRGEVTAQLLEPAGELADEIVERFVKRIKPRETLPMVLPLPHTWGPPTRIIPSISRGRLVLPTPSPAPPASPTTSGRGSRSRSQSRRRCLRV